MISDFQIRKATINDTDSIADLWNKLSYSQLSKDAYYKGSLEFNFGEKQIENAINNDDCGIFVVDYKGEIQGFIETWINRKDFCLSSDECAYILHFYLDEKIRSNKYIFGILSRLYGTAEIWAQSKNKKYLIADAFHHNQRVITILRKAGVYVYKTRMVKSL